LGEGSYGKVYKGFDEDHGDLFAIKEIDFRNISNNNNYIEAKINSFRSEIDILSKISHKNIVRYLGTNYNKEVFHIFLELCNGGSIAKMLEVYKFFTENVIKVYTRQILEGLEYLHAHNIIHRDIKGANILVDKGLCKLSDFGGAKVIVDELDLNKQNSIKGTPNWIAPEAIQNKGYTRYSDVWSIGCTVIEMATGEPPWAEFKNQMSLFYHLMKIKEPPALPSHLSDLCKHFLSCCLK
jgi:serine/threonine protein kinase